MTAPMKKNILIFIISFGVFLPVFLYLFLPKYGANSEPDFVMTAKEIGQEYQINAISAREKYSGKLIGLRNVLVLQIAESLTGVPQVVIPGGRIYFAKKSSVADLVPGDHISCNAVLSVINGYDCQFEPVYNTKKD